METIEYRTVDKSTWGNGPWQDEPDKMQWQDEATGLPCLVVRNRGGALCGYVGVAEGHPCFEVDYSGVPDEVGDVHGGLTFSGPCAHTDDESKHICHKPSPGEPDPVWWLGFDCNHGYDLAPGTNAYWRNSEHPERMDRDAHYRGLDYVRHECARLAQQLTLLSPQPRQTPGGLAPPTED